MVIHGGGVCGGCFDGHSHIFFYSVIRRFFGAQLRVQRDGAPLAQPTYYQHRCDRSDTLTHNAIIAVVEAGTQNVGQITFCLRP